MSIARGALADALLESTIVHFISKSDRVAAELTVLQTDPTPLNAAQKAALIKRLQESVSDSDKSSIAALINLVCGSDNNPSLADCTVVSVEITRLLAQRRTLASALIQERALHAAEIEKLKASIAELNATVNNLSNSAPPAADSSTGTRGISPRGRRGAVLHIDGCSPISLTGSECDGSPHVGAATVLAPAGVAAPSSGSGSQSPISGLVNFMKTAMGLP